MIGFRPPHSLARAAISALLTVSLLLLTGSTAWGLKVPAYQGYVNDYAGLLSPAARQQLNQALTSLDRTDSTQIAVLTINSLEGDPLEDFSIRAASQWQIGRKGRDNGVLLVVAKDEHKVRIEVGRGLEGVLTDLTTGRIIDNLITPAFRAGNFDQGILSGVAALIKVSRGEYSARDLKRRTRGNREPPLLFKLIFFLIVITAFLGRMARPLGIAAGTVLLPLVVFFGMGSPLSFIMLLALIPMGAMGGWLLPMLLGSMLAGHHRGGFYGGGFGGGFGGGSGFGGFGGGGFGGGGASGGW